MYPLTKKEGGCQAPFTSGSRPDALQCTHLALGPQPLSSDSRRASETKAVLLGFLCGGFFFFS